MVDKSGTPAVAEIARAVVAIRRSQSRRALARLAASRGTRTGRGARLPDAAYELLDAIDAAGGSTVTDAAVALGVDQPRASRLAAQALDAGLLRRGVDPADGRRSPLLLTAAGHRALAAIHAFRRTVIADATARWSAADRATLGRLLTRFVADFALVTDPPQD